MAEPLRITEDGFIDRGDYLQRFDHVEDIHTIQQALGNRFSGEFKTIRYQLPDGYMIAVISNYDGQNCEVSGCASGKWWHTAIYPDFFGFIFKTLGCKRASFVVDKTNTKCIELLEKGGCVFECELRGIERLLYSMTPQDFYNG